MHREKHRRNDLPEKDRKGLKIRRFGCTWALYDSLVELSLSILRVKPRANFPVIFVAKLFGVREMWGVNSNVREKTQTSLRLQEAILVEV